jgi:peptidoglycan/xylan/chitin deacetylase (PgdA/CDA1 family)
MAIVVEPPVSAKRVEGGQPPESVEPRSGEVRIGGADGGEPVLAPPLSPFSRAKAAVIKRALNAVFPRSVLVIRGEPSRGRPRVGITFDDGPDPMTPRYLDVLDACGVPATFFVVGEFAEKRHDLVLEMVRRGHEVCGHGYTHTPFPDLTPFRLEDELKRTADVLPAARTPRPLVRPPRGAFTMKSLALTVAAGFTTALWSLDSDDCRSKDPAELEARMAPGNMRDGEIVLLHENQDWTLRVLPNVVKRLKDAGFEFATMSDLLGC